ncbi:DNA polymerase III subunit delta [Arsenophonus symbiont of Ornithomya chloropus]|uniref:DNA polymerase III subunit delta n=1 Tax=Arsenophonus symbiont of Ornithomya chloropus TaxID=634121 RepID=UPI0032B1CEE7
MIKIYPEELDFYLTQKNLPSCFFVFGNDSLLLQESLDRIYKIAKLKGFTERYSHLVELKSDWDHIYYFVQSLNLFEQRKILFLTLCKNCSNIIISQKLLKLTKLLHSNVLLVLSGNKFTKKQENSQWFKKINQNSIYINCLTPKQQKLPQWITKRAKKNSLTLNKEANQMLCYYYDGNLLTIHHILNQLSILYPNSHLTVSHVITAINNIVNFTAYHWINAMFSGEIKKSWYILKQLQKEKYEETILLRTIQRELILILKLKEQTKNKKEFIKPSNNEFFLKMYHPLIISVINRLSLKQLQLAINLITKAELYLKKNNEKSIWSKLEILSILLCGEIISESFINDFTK